MTIYGVMMHFPHITRVRIYMSLVKKKQYYQAHSAITNEEASVFLFLPYYDIGRVGRRTALSDIKHAKLPTAVLRRIPGVEDPFSNII